MKIIQRQQQEELDAYRENQTKQLEILKETNAKKLEEAQKTAEEIQHAAVTPEIEAKAAELVDKAIKDISDNSSKMGTNIEAVKNAYMGLARGNATMLDNLRVGYSGTQTSMLQLAKDVGVVDESMQSFGDMTFEQVIESIHKLQEKLKITGNTEKEAAKTIQGTINATKAAWNNLITAMANPDADLTEYINNLITTIVGENEGEGLINRILPAVESALTGVGTLIEKLVPVILDRVPKLLDDNLPKLLNSAIGILDSIVNSLTTNADKIGVFVTELILKLSTWITNSLPSVIKAGMTILSELVKGLAKAMPELIPAVINCIYLIADTLTDPDNLGNIIMAALDIVLAIVDGVVNNIDKIIDVALVVIENITNTLIKPDVLTKLYTAGTKILLKVLEGIIKATPEIIKAILQLTVDMVDSIFKTDWWSIGTNIVNGLWDGIVSVWNDLTNWWRNSWNSLVGGVEKRLEINSPSRVFADIGKNMALGVEKGWDNEFGDIRKDIENGMDFNANIDSNFSTRNSNGTVTGINPIALTLNIDNFNNYSDKDIDTLADTLMYIINEKTIRQGAAYA